MIEEAIAPVKLGINRNPRQFLATSFEDVYLAKTKLHWKGPEIVMAYSVWFKLSDDTKTAELQWVESTDPDEGDWGADGEIPF